MTIRSCLAVPDGDRGVGIEVQHRTIRQAASQLFAVPCLKVQRRHAVRRRRGCRLGRTFHVKNKPILNKAHAAIATVAVSQRRGVPTRTASLGGAEADSDAQGLLGARARENRLQGILRMGAGLLADRARSPTRRGTPRCAPARS